MATSLVCKQCDTLLASVKEAQAHNEVTGHTNFEESKQKVPRIVCTECGKVCRTDAEKGLHSKFTGHNNYVDKTDEVQEINTEVQMAEAKQALEEDLEADAELLAVKRKKAATPVAGAGSSAGAAEAAAGPGGEGGGNGEASTSGEAAAAGGDDLVAPEVDAVMLKELQDMGFGAERAVRGLHFSGNSSIEGAINWLAEHENDADIDAPLLVAKGSQHKQLSAEEARAKAEEMVQRARERREREEKEAEAVRERERIRAGKELLAAQRLEEELRGKRIAEERMREKAEDARVREALRRKLEEDRKERRRKLGLPEELTEEEKAKEAERAQKKAEEEASRRHVYIKPVSVIEKMRPLLVSMKKAASGDEAFKTAASTLLKYLGNVARAPDEDKFRRINPSNSAFQARVGSVPGGVEFLRIVGFEDTGDALFMPRDKVNMEVLSAAGGELQNAMTNPFFGAL